MPAAGPCPARDGAGLGDVVPPRQAERADGQVPQGGHRPWCTAGPHPRGIFPERHIPDVVLTILYCPVSAYAFRQVSGCRLMSRQAGDRVDAFERHLAGAHRAPPADDLQCLAGVRERQPRHGDGLQAADLVAAVGGGAGAVHQRHLLPGKILHQRVQGRVVGFEHGDVVRVFLLDQELCVIGLGQQCIENHHRTGQVKRVQQRSERGDLNALGVDLALGQHDAVAAQRGQQVDAAAVGAGGAAQGFAVHRDGRPHRAGRRVFVLVGGAAGVRAGGEPVADRRVERVAVDALQHQAYGRLAGRPVGPVRIAQRGPAAEEELGRGVGGPLGDCGEGFRSGQDCAGCQGQDV